MFISGAIVVTGSVFTVILSSLSWYARQYYLALENNFQLVYSFYVTFLFSIVLLLLGFYILYLWLTRHFPQDSVAGFIGQAVSSGLTKKVFLASCLLYAFFYMFASGTIVFQPTIDFVKVFGTNSAGIFAEVCCGSPGVVPKLIVAFPEIHLAFIFAPINLVLLPVFSFLFALNTSTSASAWLNTRIFSRGVFPFLGGSILSFFTSCPSCAAAFFLGSITGINSALSVVLAPYQLLLIYVSLPLLLSSLIVTAYLSRNSIYAKCNLSKPPV
jgi:hypothetical protein